MTTELSKWWRGNLNCFRCKSKLGLLSKHICRDCRQICCGKCSNQHVAPMFGGKIRLCVACYEKRFQKTSPIGWAQFSPAEERNETVRSRAHQELPGRDEGQLRLKEQEELALALALSQIEWEEMPNSDSHNLYPIADDEMRERTRLQQLMQRDEGLQLAHVMSIKEQQSRLEARKAPTLSSYLDRSFWEKQSSGQQMIAPQKFANAAFSGAQNTAHALDEAEVKDFEREKLAKTVEICQIAREQASALENRVQSSLVRRGSIANDSGIRSLASRVSNCHGHVLSMLTKLEADQEYYAGLQQKLAHIWESKRLLKGLRDEYAQHKEVSVQQARQQGRLYMQQQLERVDQGVSANLPMRAQPIDVPSKQQPQIYPSVVDKQSETSANTNSSA